jgi:hypothetical protein
MLDGSIVVEPGASMPYKIAQDYLALKVTQLHAEAETLSHGDARDALMCRARRVEAASLVIGHWLPAQRLV